MHLTYTTLSLGQFSKYKALMLSAIVTLLLFACWVNQANAKQAHGIVGIAHVAFQVSNLEKSVKQYSQHYGFMPAFSVQDNGSASYVKISDEQFIKLVEVNEKTDNNRLIEIAFQVTNLRHFVTFLKSKGFNPSSIYIAADGTLASTLIGPSQHKLLFVEYRANSLQAKTKGQYLGENRLADRLLHVGFTVDNEAQANAFYQQALGFEEIWRAARQDNGPDAWVNMKIPESRGDYVEYVLIDGMEPSRNQLGSMNHICLLSHDIQITRQQLKQNGLDDPNRHQPMVGRSNRWIINIHDLDGTRTEFMETKPAY
ncbi:VOC family protein [Paraglaciecola aquimarina]|uniref:VOC family protein n=1 Tax=Paraglaciecola algarum TaxID=3050085 RepID=A0ABS9D6K9_9ALTE|nr:VOC family protein [Paraglaciecola sp. G1-23]MCF2947662.1 VOC family protein [Paraglaciecola sp. G1-23]